MFYVIHENNQNSFTVSAVHVRRFELRGVILTCPNLRARQLSLLLFAQVMVQMMVEAAFSSNATSLKVKVAQVIVG